MASAFLEKLEEEVTCPICLELLTEPVSLDCGHSFCQACITANQKMSTVVQEGEGSCPMCRIRYQIENLRPSWHQANIVEMLKEVKLSPEEGQKVDHCVRHGEKLQLFCKEDGKIICWLCERSQEHRGHHTFLTEEVVQEHQEKLQAALEKLKKQQQEAEKLEADIQEERTSWKNLIQYERETVQSEFEKLRAILDCEEQNQLQKLEKEERGILKILAESEIELAQQSQVVRDLISDVERRLQGTAMEMLQDVNSITTRCQNFNLKTPKTFPKKQSRVFQAPDLKGMLQALKELTDMQLYWVDLKLTPRKNSNTFNFFNLTQMEFSFEKCSTPANSSSNDYYSIGGSPLMTSGQHYWEVDVSNKSAWILGICEVKELQWLVRNCFTQVVSYQPRHGYWVIGLKNQVEYTAFQDSSSNDPLIVTLFLSVPPSRIGVFLDYDAGTLSFFNVTNGFLIYKFSSCRFFPMVCPYFNPINCSIPMTLCLPSL